MFHLASFVISRYLCFCIILPLAEAAITNKNIFLHQTITIKGSKEINSIWKYAGPAKRLKMCKMCENQQKPIKCHKMCLKIEGGNFQDISQFKCENLSSFDVFRWILRYSAEFILSRSHMLCRFFFKIMNRHFLSKLEISNYFNQLYRWIPIFIKTIKFLQNLIFVQKEDSISKRSKSSDNIIGTQQSKLAINNVVKPFTTSKSAQQLNKLFNNSKSWGLFLDLLALITISFAKKGKIYIVWWKLNAFTLISQTSLIECFWLTNSLIWNAFHHFLNINK